MRKIIGFAGLMCLMIPAAWAQSTTPTSTPSVPGAMDPNLTAAQQQMQNYYGGYYVLPGFQPPPGTLPSEEDAEQENVKYRYKDPKKGDLLYGVERPQRLFNNIPSRW